MDGDLLCEFFSADADVSERRVDYTQGLEDKIKSMESEVSQSRQSISILSSNELHYKAWVQDLESALYRQARGNEVEGLRRTWTRLITPVPKMKIGGGNGGAGGKKGKGRMPVTASGSGSRSGYSERDRERVDPVQRPYEMRMGTERTRLNDPLSTLVQATMVSDQSLLPPGSYSSHNPSITQIQPHQPSMAETTTFHPPLPAVSPSYAFPPTQTPTLPPPHTPREQHRTERFPTTLSRLPPGSVSHNPSRRPSTSYNPTSSWEHTQTHPEIGGLGGSHPLLKRKRSVSGPTTIQSPYSQSIRDSNPLPPLKSLSEPATARHPFLHLPPTSASTSSAITLPPILSLETTPREHQRKRQDIQEEQERQRRQGGVSLPVGVGSHHRQDMGVTLPSLGLLDRTISTSNSIARLDPDSNSVIPLTTSPVGLGAPSVRNPTTPPMISLLSGESGESGGVSSPASTLGNSMSIDHLLTPKAPRSA